MDSDTIEHPMAELEAVAWREPKGWQRPDWLDPEPCFAMLPMHPDRLLWCIHAIGWTRGSLGKRSRTSTTTIKRMEKANRSIPDALAIWLESQVTRALTPVGPLHVFWQAPADWQRPVWLKPEWCPIHSPMIIARMMWCLHVVGWTLFETARRYGPGITERGLHEMLDGYRPIPGEFAAWLEVHTMRVLTTQPVAPEWRSVFIVDPYDDEEEDAELTASE
jgi:hypothetical protein